MQGSYGSDRRILRAFYTQYVAVLLIVLTFTVGAFQRTHAAVAPVPALRRAPLAAPIGVLLVEGTFTESGTVRGESSQLAAVAQLLRSHDVNAQVTIPVERIDFDTEASSFARMLRQVDGIREFFNSRSVPAGAVQVRVVTETGVLESPRAELRVEIVPMYPSHAGGW